MIYICFHPSLPFAAICLVLLCEPPEFHFFSGLAVGLVSCLTLISKRSALATVPCFFYSAASARRTRHPAKKLLASSNIAASVDIARARFISLRVLTSALPLNVADAVALDLPVYACFDSLLLLVQPCGGASISSLSCCGFGSLSRRAIFTPTRTSRDLRLSQV